MSAQPELPSEDDPDSGVRARPLSETEILRREVMALQAEVARLRRRVDAVERKARPRGTW